VLVPADGGVARALPGVVEGDDIVRWSADGASVFVAHGDVPLDVFRVDVATGKRTLWKTLAPADMSGVDGLGPVEITPDGRTYAYSCSRVLSDLYIAEGLK
jgi:Tol biopolymer transport system component